MLMLKYKCPLCGRIHYGREGLKPGYCTTCGPKGELIQDIDWDKVSKLMVDAINRGTKAFIDLANAMKVVKENGYLEIADYWDSPNR